MYNKSCTISSIRKFIIVMLYKEKVVVLVMRQINLLFHSFVSPAAFFTIPKQYKNSTTVENFPVLMIIAQVIKLNTYLEYNF
jgi:hypothetical protein